MFNNLLGTVDFCQSYLNRKKKNAFVGDYFQLINTQLYWCSSSRMVNVGLTQKKLQCLCECVHSAEGTCHPVQHWFTGVFLTVAGERWSSVAHRTALATQTTLLLGKIYRLFCSFFYGI